MKTKKDLKRIKANLAILEDRMPVLAGMLRAGIENTLSARASAKARKKKERLWKY